ncbi:MAG: hypothetical protein N2V78_00130, partial [Methanophagales archaeon]|nr:hypothetical protein [Methanophagales archaeon]
MALTRQSEQLNGYCSDIRKIDGGEGVKKNDGEKEGSNSSPKARIGKVEKEYERFNVYTNPQANPQ